MVRKGTIADAETIARYNVALAKESEHFDLDYERTLLGVKRIFESEEKGFYLVAEIDGGIIGQLMITYEWSDWRNGLFWWIQSVYVKKEFRSQKVFRSLYDRVVVMAKKEGNVCGIRLYAEKDNDGALNVYQKIGMTITNYHLLEVDFVLKR